MKKRTLAILLIIPFVISLLTFVSIKILDNAVAVDILGIMWNYDENEGFKIRDEGYKLEAEAIVDQDKILANGNNLVWFANENDNNVSIEDNGDGTCVLKALKEGQCEIVCSNERGSVSRHFEATIFADGAMIINPKRKGSSNSISSTKYYGLYDLSYSELKTDSYSKNKSSFEVTTTAYLDNGESHVNRLKECSDNVSYKDGVVSIESSNGDKLSYITLEDESRKYNATYEFVVIDGVNIYSYNDLLMATNFSTEGENAVMQINLDSLKNTYKKNDAGNYISEKLDSSKDNTELFGNYDFNTNSFSFEKELYSFTTTYDTSFIEIYNKEHANDKIDTTLKAGIHLRKNLYGNGFTINMDGLCYPHNGSIDTTSGKLTPDSEKDYFHGPVPFIYLGASSLNLISALGQDNCGIYVSDDNVTIDDVKISNVDEVDNLYNLTYTGTVIDITNAKNVTVKNSVLSNGKLCLRAFDTDGLTVDNCILKNGGEFNMMVGSNKKNGYDTSKSVKGTFKGDNINKTFSEFFDETGDDTANSIIDSFVSDTMEGKASEYDYETELKKIQSYLDNDTGLYLNDGSKNYAANITINDTMFGRSGVFSLASESMFNGALLYGGMPSTITSLLGTLVSPLPSKNGGTSYPVHVTLRGDTRFYDWKNIDSIDVSSLIEENISAMIASLGREDVKVTVDDIFPLKEALRKEAKSKGLIYQKDGVDYVNTSIAYYGGGLNISDMSDESDHMYNTYSDELSVSLIKELSNSSLKSYWAMLVDAVIVTIGSNDFRFVINGSKESSDPMLFDKVPNVSDLKKNAQKGD